MYETFINMIFKLKKIDLSFQFWLLNMMVVAKFVYAIQSMKFIPLVF